MNKLVGVLGAGHMGGKMVARFIEAGVTVYVYDTAEQTRAQMKKLGAVVCESPKALADSADVILTSLPNSKILELALVKEGFLASMHPGTVILETSSTMPETMTHIAGEAKKYGVDIIDCPVSGGPLEARTGKLVLIIAGDTKTVRNHKDIIDLLGEKQFYVGQKPGSAKAVKIVNNTMSMGNLAVASEAFALGIKYGLDPQELFDILKVSGGTSNQFSKRFQKVVDGDFTALATVEISRKDLTLAIDWAETKGIPMEIARLARSYYEKAIAMGRENEDMCSVYNAFL